MPIPAGNFNRRVQIWRDVPGAENGLGEKVITPTLYFECWASKNYLTREEKQAAAQDTSSEYNKFTVRYCTETATVTSADRLRFEGVDYNINNIQEYGQREAFDLYVTGIKA